MALEYKYDQGQMRVNSSGGGKSTCWYLMIFLLLLSFGGGAWLYLTGYLTPMESADSENSFSTSLRGKMNEQKTLLKSHGQTIKGLTKELGLLKREHEIQLVANDELNNKLQLSEKKAAEAHEELLLYGNILNVKDMKQGLHIQHFGLKLVKVDKDGKKIATNTRFRYRIVLSYIRSDDSSAKGKFSIKIVGKQKGKSVTLDHKKLVPMGEGTALAGFALKYYQSLEGEVELPKDFTPEKVKLSVSPSSGSVLAKTQNWSTVMKVK